MNLYVKVYFVIPNNMSRSTYFDKSVGEEISKKFMLPVKYCSCPGCGRIYGHHKTKVCSNCQECSTCCNCKNKNLIDPEIFVFFK